MYFAMKVALTPRAPPFTARFNSRPSSAAARVGAMLEIDLNRPADSA
jgi:hypothetical protein